MDRQEKRGGGGDLPAVGDGGGGRRRLGERRLGLIYRRGGRNQKWKAELVRTNELVLRRWRADGIVFFIPLFTKPILVLAFVRVIIYNFSWDGVWLMYYSHEYILVILFVSTF